MPLILLRHGRIERPSARTYIGQLDLPLAAAGQEQAKAWGERFSGRNVAAVIASDLRRARAFGERVAAAVGRQVTVDARWREISLGAWEGLPMAEVEAAHPELYARRGLAPHEVRPPGGEHLGDVLRRALPAFQELAASQRDGEWTIVVTHAGVIRVLRCHVEGRPLAGALQLETPLASGWEYLAESNTFVQL